MFCQIPGKTRLLVIPDAGCQLSDNSLISASSLLVRAPASLTAAAPLVPLFVSASPTPCPFPLFPAFLSLVPRSPPSRSLSSLSLASPTPAAPFAERAIEMCVLQQRQGRRIRVSRTFALTHASARELAQTHVHRTRARAHKKGSFAHPGYAGMQAAAKARSAASSLPDWRGRWADSIAYM